VHGHHNYLIATQPLHKEKILQKGHGQKLITHGDFRASRPDCTLQIREPLHYGSINALAAVQNDIVISAGADKVIF
jgi:hypothetical protein